MQSIITNQTNKEIEEFIEGDYISIKDIFSPYIMIMTLVAPYGPDQ